MRLNFYRVSFPIFLTFISLISTAGTKQWTYFSPQAETKKDLASVHVLSATSTETELRFTLEGFSQAPVQTPNGNAFVISSTNLTRILEAGAPDLGKMAFSLAIPDHAHMVVDEINSAFVTYQNIDVAPCK